MPLRSRRSPKAVVLLCVTSKSPATNSCQPSFNLRRHFDHNSLHIVSKMTNTPLSGFDWQLIQLLQQDGRASISALANQLGRSRSTVSEQVQRLQDCGVITGVAARLNEEKLGFGISAFVRLSAASSRHRQIVNAVCDIPEVAECHVLTGSELLMIRLVARDMAHLRELVDTLTQYGSTHTDVIFSSVKTELKVDPSFYRLT